MADLAKTMSSPVFTIPTLSRPTSSSPAPGGGGSKAGEGGRCLTGYSPSQTGKILDVTAFSTDLAWRGTDV